ncbi:MULTISPECIES: tautomerase family protein [Mycolicibacterium]|uniref:tautomerase family protein n=1 Tax=Mycolicibacterium TaxID=1866885 RepID=UPI0009390D68|nr:tautomerase family protein [Mycolicibacterium mageritense]OKH72626.1 tautomerase [Mycobacterium sp. SWH-M3]GJJ18411.1 putative 4-oxalocrotonate tautomerase [Mycolicibacterium mageritense]
MPLVRIDLLNHHERDHIRDIADAIHRGVVTVLGIPERDRFQVITTHAADEIIALDAGLDFDRSRDVVVIQIFTQRGRSIETKERLFAELAAQLQTVGVRGNDMFVGLVENGPEDWTFGFGKAQYLTGELAVPEPN